MAPVPRPWLDWAIAAAVTAFAVVDDADSAERHPAAASSSRRSRCRWPGAAPHRWPPRPRSRRASSISALPTLSEWRCGVAIPVALAIAFSVAARRDRRDALARARARARRPRRPAVHRPAARRRCALRPAAVRGRVVGRAPRALAQPRSPPSSPSARGSSRGRARTARASRSRSTARGSRPTSRRRRGGRCTRSSSWPTPAPRSRPMRRGPRSRRSSGGAASRWTRCATCSGRLRGAELATAPQPTLADLEALRHRRASSCAPAASGARCPRGSSSPAIGWSSTRWRRSPPTSRRRSTSSLRYAPDALELEIRGRDGRRQRRGGRARGRARAGHGARRALQPRAPRRRRLRPAQPDPRRGEPP